MMWMSRAERWRQLQKQKQRKPIKIIRLRKTVGFVKLADDLKREIGVQMLLNQFREGGTCLDSPIPLPIGKELLLTLTAPETIQLRAKIFDCRKGAVSSRVISCAPLPYRVYVDFIPRTISEESVLKKLYCDLSELLYGAFNKDKKEWWRFY